MGLTTFALPTILLVSLYFLFQLEISSIFEQAYDKAIADASAAGDENYYSSGNISIFKEIWLLYYSLYY